MQEAQLTQAYLQEHGIEQEILYAGNGAAY